jgi:hypothetical protein
MASSPSLAGHRHRTRHAFSSEEDSHLRNLVSRFGDDAWDKIAARMPTRDRRQCRERWINYLSPTVTNGPWTNEEEDLLKNKVESLGRSWKAILPFFPGRTDINIKNHWKQMGKMRPVTVKSEPAADIFDELISSWMVERSPSMTEQNNFGEFDTLF